MIVPHSVPTPHVAENAPRILMCPPNHYGIEYEINPWMCRQRPCDHTAAVRQWRDLRNLLEAAGAQVFCMSPVLGMPDLIFTANAALIYRDLAVIARFRYPQRQVEVPQDEHWLSSHGFRTCHLPPGMFFEGAGDALFCGDTLFAGYRIRSDIRSHLNLGVLLGCRVIPLELVQPHFYHLDTCFCPLGPGLAIYYPPAFDDYGQRALAESIAELIPVEADEAQNFACNAVVLGRTVITNVGCPGLHDQLRRRGFQPQETPLGEFVKAGGSAKCLTLRLDGEDAAAWRRHADAEKEAV
jgi:N-dimethylarginine dimethylaminohydrolase